MTEVSDEFKNQALFDLNLNYDLQKQADKANIKGQEIESEARRYQIEDEANMARADLQKMRTEALRSVETELKLISDPQLKRQAEAYLDKLFSKPIDGASKDDSYIVRDQTREKAQKEAAKIDLDGSKKSLWGKLKNKAKNFLKPHNPKRRLEEAIAKLQVEITMDAPAYNQLRQQSIEENGTSSFKNITQSNNNTITSFLNKASDARIKNEKLNEAAQPYFQAQKVAEAQMEARLEVRDNAAKEIELRSAAREGIGIKDINANSGVDKLADRAKAMEGMTPQQRLAFRMKELRGTKKETAQPVVKRELDSNIMSQKLNNQRQ